MSTAVRLVHLSDIHLTAHPLGWGWRDWLSKRLSGWLNTHCLPRHRRFLQADAVLAALMSDIRDRSQPDCVVFSGDATTLGFSRELERAAAGLHLGTPTELPGLAVPGNHDYYTPPAERSGLFEQHFAPWLQGERVDGAPYPFARQVGPVWLVGVNSSAGTLLPWDATGWIAADQLRRLEQLLAHLPPGPRILVTHYPASDPHGQPEGTWHRLRNLPDLVAVAGRGGVSLWMHGHRHRAYWIDDRQVAPFPVICAGSATEEGNWGYNEYRIEGRQLQGRRRTYQSKTGTFQEETSFGLTLPAG